MIKVCKDSGTYAMFRYGTNGSGPRPESYLEDLEAVEDGEFRTIEEEDTLLKHIQDQKLFNTNFTFSNQFQTDFKELGFHEKNLVN